MAAFDYQASNGGSGQYFIAFFCCLFFAPFFYKKDHLYTTSTSCPSFNQQFLLFKPNLNGHVAQLEEHEPSKLGVLGSIPNLIKFYHFVSPNYYKITQKSLLLLM